MFRLILLATVGLAAALDAAGPSIRTKDGNMIGTSTPHSPVRGKKL